MGGAGARSRARYPPIGRPRHVYMAQLSHDPPRPALPSPVVHVQRCDRQQQLVKLRDKTPRIHSHRRLGPHRRPNEAPNSFPDEIRPPSVTPIALGPNLVWETFRRLIWVSSGPQCRLRLALGPHSGVLGARSTCGNEFGATTLGSDSCQLVGGGIACWLAAGINIESARCWATRGATASCVGGSGVLRLVIGRPRRLAIGLARRPTVARRSGCDCAFVGHSSTSLRNSVRRLSIAIAT